MTPNKVYSEVFPKSSETFNLAWMFDSSYQSASKNNLNLKNQIEEVFNTWIHKWKTSVSKIPKLQVVKEANLFFLEDTRFDKDTKVQISNEQAAVDLMGVSRDSRNKELEWGVENGVLYFLDGEFIPLATAHPHLLKEFHNDK